MTMSDMLGFCIQFCNVVFDCTNTYNITELPTTQLFLTVPTLN